MTKNGDFGKSYSTISEALAQASSTDSVEIFINKVLIAILESENLTMEYKEVVLNELLKMADDCLFLVEIYVNYDCDVNYKTVFYDLINILTKIIYGMYRKEINKEI